MWELLHQLSLGHWSSLDPSSLEKKKKVKVRWSGVLPRIIQIFSELAGAAQPLVLFPSFFPRASVSYYKIIVTASTPNLGFPGGFKESTCKAGGIRSCKFDPWVGKIPWRRIWQPTPVSCLENPWTEEPGGLQSMVWLRAGHDWNDLAHTQPQTTVSWELVFFWATGISSHCRMKGRLNEWPALWFVLYGWSQNQSEWDAESQGL